MRLVSKEKLEMAKLLVEKNGADLVEDSVLKNLKLGQYEDNDEKLGIDYNTITQALLKGVHCVDFEHGKKIIRHIDRLCLRAYNCRTFLLSSGMYDFFMNSYGKLWALTKEELQ